MIVKTVVRRVLLLISLSHKGLLKNLYSQIPDMLCKHLLEEDNKDPFAITPNPEETASSICGEASRVTTVWWTPALASEWLCDELWCMS